MFKSIREAIDKNEGGLEKFSQGYKYYGLNRGSHEGKEGIWYREWAPGARVRTPGLEPVGLRVTALWFHRHAEQAVTDIKHGGAAQGWITFGSAYCMGGFCLLKLVCIGQRLTLMLSRIARHLRAQIKLG